MTPSENIAANKKLVLALLKGAFVDQDSTVFDRILGTRVGYKAADLVAAGDWGKMSALRGNDVIGVPLEEATGTLKIVPPEWARFLETFSK